MGIFITQSAMKNKTNDIMIVKKDSNKQRLNFKMRRKLRNGYSPDNYSKVLNPKDPNDLALLFEDLEYVIGAPVEKAYQKYRKTKNDGFPFF